MSEREARLIEAARQALRYFSNHTRGNALNGPHDDLRIGRQLFTVLALYADVAPVSDRDRHHPVPPFEDEQHRERYQAGVRGFFRRTEPDQKQTA